MNQLQTRTRDSTSISRRDEAPKPLSREQENCITAWTNRLEGRVLSEALPARLRDALSSRKRVLEAHLTPGRHQPVAELIAGFLGFFKSSGPEDDHIKTLAGYCEALRRLPFWAIRQACDEWMQGLRGKEPGWAPKPPELARAAAELTMPWQKELIRIRNLIYAEAGRADAGPEERSRVGLKMKALADDLARRRANWELDMQQRSSGTRAGLGEQGIAKRG